MRSASFEPAAAAAVAAVILNWNGADDTLACLESLRESTIRVHAVVVDNGSTDDSIERITGSTQADTVIATGTNLGYAEGNNVGIRHALAQRAPVIAVLNNDTVVEPNAFALLIEQLNASEHRALSPDIRYFDKPSESWFAGGVVERGWPRHLQPDELAGDMRPLRPSDCLSGCCIVARRETWEHVGFFDPGYFLIFEDSDWSLRAALQGVELYVVTGSRIRHRVSRSFAQGPSSLLGAYYFVRNGLRFEARYFGRHLVRFGWNWLVRPAPELVRERRLSELGFRLLGAFAFATRQSGQAPHVLERLASRLAR